MLVQRKPCPGEYSKATSPHTDTNQKSRIGRCSGSVASVAALDGSGLQNVDRVIYKVTASDPCDIVVLLVLGFLTSAAAFAL